MLAYFPTPYSDELLYSLIARYAVHTGQEKQKVVIRDIFDDSSATAIPDLPSHINVFLQKVKNVYQTCSDEILFKHTMLPLYLPFLHPSNASRVLNSMCTSYGGAIHVTAGISASTVKQPKYFRYCPLCAKEQIDILGEPFWRRMHQIPGVNVCVDHRSILKESKVYYHPKNKHLFRAAIESVTTKKTGLICKNSDELFLANRFQDLMNVAPFGGDITHSQWSEFYIHIAKKNNLFKRTIIDHEKVENIIKNRWLNTSLRMYVQGLGSENSWLRNIFRKHRKSFNPLYHLIVWVSLAPDMSVEDIITTVYSLPISCKSKKEVYSNVIDTKTYLLRNRWLELVKIFPNHGIKDLRRTHDGGAVYSWLYKHDHLWLENNKPNRKTPVPTSKVNYLDWDSSLVPILEEFKENLLKLQNRPRMSRSFLIKSLPRYSSVEKNLVKLKETRRWLEREAESIEEYQKFRALRSINLLNLQGVEPRRWKILRMAGINHQKLSPEVSLYIDKLLFPPI
mgnify:CR=1 FL=1